MCETTCKSWCWHVTYLYTCVLATCTCIPDETLVTHTHTAHNGFPSSKKRFLNGKSFSTTHGTGRGSGSGDNINLLQDQEITVCPVSVC